jgi:predicted MFS family arabinose efflux permease
MWLAAATVVAVLALSNEPAPLYVLWQHQLGFSTATLTLIYAGYIVGLLAALTTAGILADRFGRKAVLLPALGIAFLATLLFATADSITALLTARLLTGIAVGAYLAAGLAAIADLAPARNKKLGSLIGSAAMVGGAALGPLLTGLLSEYLPHPTVTVFAVQAALLLLALPVLLRLPLPRPTNSTSTHPTRLIRIPTVPSAQRRHLLLGLAVFAPAITATGFALSLGPALLAQQLHTGNRLISGGMIFLLFAAATAIQFAVRGLPTRTLFRLGAALTVLGMAALIAAVTLTSVTLLLAAAILSGLGQGTAQLGALASLGAHLPATRLAEGNAALTGGGYLLAGTLPVSAGYLSDALGSTTGTILFGTTVALIIATGAHFATRTRRP